jgi:hypothetical protein
MDYVMSVVIAQKGKADDVMPLVIAENQRIQEQNDREREIARLEALV